jgi:hypothetical protein
MPYTKHSECLSDHIVFFHFQYHARLLRGPVVTADPNPPDSDEQCITRSSVPLQSEMEHGLPGDVVSTREPEHAPYTTSELHR